MGMGERWIFLKTSAPIASEDTFRMSLILAGSISLDSIFNEKQLKNINMVYSCDYTMQNFAYFRKHFSEKLNLDFVTKR
jgi:hypothetical protein